MQQIKSETGCDVIFNGGFYNTRTFKPECHLRVEGKTLANDTSYTVNGYAWRDAQMIFTPSSQMNNYPNYISCTEAVKGGKGEDPLYYPSDVAGARGRTAIGLAKDGRLILWCAKDGGKEVMTPEQTRDKMVALGAYSAIILDGGGSSQAITPDWTITSTRNVQNYICVWTAPKPKRRFIDVSEWQGGIDWAKVRNSVDGAILRARSGKSYVDKKFAYNAAECNRLDIPIGAYLLSKAVTVAEAKAEAAELLKAVAPYKMTLPLAFDYEYDSHKGVNVTKELVSGMALAFCEEITKAGYTALNYTNIDYLTRYFTPEAESKYGIWLAAWRDSVPSEYEKQPHDCVIWQYGVGRISGISTDVDMNYAYADFSNPNGGKPIAAPVSACSYDEPTGNIKMGSIGNGARWVQWHLNACGAELTVDGVFGAASVKALIAFQSANGLQPDGICGLATRTALKEKATEKPAEETPEEPVVHVDGCPYAEPTKNVSYGNKGESVQWLQWHLAQCGYAVSIDGDFGPATRNALINFQSTNKLTADGICGKQTRDALKAVVGRDDSGGQSAYKQTLIVKRNQMLDYIEHRVGDLYVYGAQGEEAGDKIIDWSARCFPSYTTALRAQRMKNYLATHKTNDYGEPIRAVDCSGLFWAAENHYELPLVDGKDIDDATAAGLYYTYCTPISKSQLQPLDLVFNTDLSHVGVVGRDGKIYEAAGSDIGVVCNDSVDVRRVKSIYGTAYGCSSYYTKNPWTKFGRLKIYAEAGL